MELGVEVTIEENGKTKIVSECYLLNALVDLTATAESKKLTQYKQRFGTQEIAVGVAETHDYLD